MVLSRRVTLWCAVFFLLWCHPASARQRLIDFSGVPDRPQQASAALGEFHGIRRDLVETDGDGNTLPYVRHPYVLPVTAQLVSARETRVGADPRMIIELLVRNAGNSPYWLPISAAQGRTAVLPGSKARRQLLIDVKIQDPTLRREQTISGFFLDGSTTAANSLLRLAPKESVLLRFSVSLSLIAGWSRSDRLTLQAVVSEQELADDRYVVRDYSADVVSDPVVFRPERPDVK
jgi:hypothetical protein